MTKSESKKLTLASDFNEIEKVEAFVNDFIGASDEELFNKVQLALNEAVTNAVVHGNKNDSSKKVHIAAKRTDERIEITVKDEGGGFDPAAVPDPTDEEQLLKAGGRGVFLIHQYADEVSFEENGTLVRMFFFID